MKVIVCFVMVVILSGCNRQRVEVGDSGTVELLCSGRWKIVSLKINGMPDEKLKGSSFVFFRNGNLEVVDPAGVHIGGRWHVVSIEATDDRPASDFVLTLKFHRHSSMKLLMNNWQIVYETDNEIVLADGEESIVDSLVMIKSK